MVTGEPCLCDGLDPWYYDDEDLCDPLCQDCEHRSSEHRRDGSCAVWTEAPPWPADVIVEDCS